MFSVKHTFSLYNNNKPFPRDSCSKINYISNLIWRKGLERNKESPVFGLKLLILFYNNNTNNFQGKARADEDEANTIGTLAECMAPLGQDVERFLNKLLTCFLSRCKSSNSDVRNNSLFALGEMALHGKQVLYKYPLHIINLLLQ